MQGVREIASLVFWKDNKQTLLVDDAMQNKRNFPREKQVILQQLLTDQEIEILNPRQSIHHQKQNRQDNV